MSPPAKLERLGSRLLPLGCCCCAAAEGCCCCRSSFLPWPILFYYYYRALHNISFPFLLRSVLFESHHPLLPPLLVRPRLRLGCLVLAGCVCPIAAVRPVCESRSLSLLLFLVARHKTLSLLLSLLFFCCTDTHTLGGYPVIPWPVRDIQTTVRYINSRRNSPLSLSGPTRRRQIKPDDPILSVSLCPIAVGAGCCWPSMQTGDVQIASCCSGAHAGSRHPGLTILGPD